MSTYLSPAQIAEQLAIAHDAVLDLIRSGELPATHVGRCCDAKRPTYRVAVEDLESFLLRRRTQPPAAKQTRRRKLPPVKCYV